MANHGNDCKIPPSSASSINNNNHFHYHLYQYQSNHCCFNLLDHRKSSSSTVTTTASNETYQQSITNSCPLGVTDVSLSLNAQHGSKEESKAIDEKLSGGIATNHFNIPLSCENNTPSSFDDRSRSQTAEKIIEIELSNETFRKPQDEQDDCSCTKKYLPYKINERNVWQVYETSDCKYIQSKCEIDEIYQPPPDTASSTMTTSEMLHSRSNFSNEIICHAINHATNHRENALEKVEISQASSNNENSIYTPTFNIKPLNLDSSCHCNEDEEVDENREDERIEIEPEVSSINSVVKEV
jgi:hypothetical protein